MTPKQKRAMRKGQMLMKRATPAMRAKWARKAAATRAAKRLTPPPQRFRGMDNDDSYLFQDNPLVGGEKLPVKLREDIKRRYLHRFTGEHRPAWALHSNQTPPSHDTDDQWIDDHAFYVVGDRLSHKHRHAEPRYMAPNPPFRSFLGGVASRGVISAGDYITIKTPQGGTLRGKAVMPSSSGGWVINLGGRHGTPAVADEENTVSIRKKRSNPELMILSNPGKKKRRKKSKMGRRCRGRKGRGPVKVILKKRKGAKLKYKGKTISLKSLVKRIGKLKAGKYLCRSKKGSYRVKRIGYSKKK